MRLCAKSENPRGRKGRGFRQGERIILKRDGVKNQTLNGEGGADSRESHFFTANGIIRGVGASVAGVSTPVAAVSLAARVC